MRPHARILLGLCIALGLFALCLLSACFLPPLSSFGSLQSILAGTLASSSSRHLLNSKEVHSMIPALLPPN